MAEFYLLSMKEFNLAIVFCNAISESYFWTRSASGETMDAAKRKAVFIVAWIAFIVAIFIKMVFDLIGTHGLTAEKINLIVETTVIFTIFALLGILFVLRKFGHSVRELKHVHKFIKRAIEIEEIEAKRKKQPYLIVVDSREYDLGYYLLAIIVSTIAFYGISVLLIIERGYYFAEVLFEGIARGLVVAILSANLLIPIIYFALKRSLSDGKRIAFGIPAKAWIFAGILLLSSNLISPSELYLMTAIFTILLGVIAELYLKIQRFKQIFSVLFFATMFLQYFWVVQKLILS